MWHKNGTQAKSISILYFIFIQKQNKKCLLNPLSLQKFVLPILIYNGTQRKLMAIIEKLIILFIPGASGFGKMIVLFLIQSYYQGF